MYVPVDANRLLLCKVVTGHRDIRVGPESVI